MVSFYGRLTHEGKERRQLPGGGILKCGRRLDGSKRREEIGAAEVPMELLWSLGKWHICIGIEGGEGGRFLLDLRP